MESISLTTVYILLLLLPGFVSSLIARSLSFKPDMTQFDKLISAFVYTFFIHIIYVLVSGSFTPWTIQLQNGEIHVQVVSRVGVAFFLAVAVLMGCLAGLLKNKDWHMGLARALQLTSRTSRQSLWTDVFLDKKGATVSVLLKDGRSVYGWPEYFADSFHDGPVVFLKEASWRTEGGDPVRIPDPGILIKGDEIHSIQFYIK
jgi:hypothetical protein